MEQPETKEKKVSGESAERPMNRRETSRDWGNDRTERLSIRVSKLEKSRYEKLAAASRASLPDFLRTGMNRLWKKSGLQD